MAISPEDENRIKYIQGSALPADMKQRLIAQIQARTGSQDTFSTISDQSASAANFANAGEQGFGRLGLESSALRGQLRGLASGQQSLSAEQLRQGLQQNMASQMSMAAGARPANSPMMALQASQNAARLGSGLAGQQAMAGIAERQAAMQSLGNMLGQEQDMNLRAALGSRGQAIGGYSNVYGMANDVLQNEQARNDAAKQRQLDTGMAIGGIIAGKIPNGNPAPKGGKKPPDYGYNDDGSYK